MSNRKATPRGQMTRGANSAPAIMLMTPEIRCTFMPNPPLEPVAPVSSRRRQKWTAVADYLKEFENTQPPERKLQPTPKAITEERRRKRREEHEKQKKPVVEEYRREQRESGGEFKGMNCYNTLFVGRLAYEVEERKLLREMETYGPVKDLHIVKDTKDSRKSRGYAFVEFEHEDDLKRAYRSADGVKIEGRHIVVDVERGHTVPDWLPRRLGGGLGGTRIGGRGKNVTRPGRFDPSRPEIPPQGPPMGGGGGPPPSYPPPHQYGGPGPGYGGPPRGGGRFGGGRFGGPPPRGGGYDRFRGGPPDRKRYRSRSPERYNDRRRRY